MEQILLANFSNIFINQQQNITTYSHPLIHSLTNHLIFNIYHQKYQKSIQSYLHKNQNILKIKNKHQDQNQINIKINLLSEQEMFKKQINHYEQTNYQTHQNKTNQNHQIFQQLQIISNVVYKEGFTFSQKIYNGKFSLKAIQLCISTHIQKININIKNLLYQTPLALQISPYLQRFQINQTQEIILSSMQIEQNLQFNESNYKNIDQDVNQKTSFQNQEMVNVNNLVDISNNVLKTGNYKNINNKKQGKSSEHKLKSPLKGRRCYCCNQNQQFQQTQLKQPQEFYYKSNQNFIKCQKQKSKCHLIAANNERNSKQLFFQIQSRQKAYSSLQEKKTVKLSNKKHKKNKDQTSEIVVLQEQYLQNRNNRSLQNKRSYSNKSNQSHKKCFCCSRIKQKATQSIFKIQNKKKPNNNEFTHRNQQQKTPFKYIKAQSSHKKSINNNGQLNFNIRNAKNQNLKSSEHNNIKLDQIDQINFVQNKQQSNIDSLLNDIQQKQEEQLGSKDRKFQLKKERNNIQKIEQSDMETKRLLQLGNKLVQNKKQKKINYSYRLQASLKNHERLSSRGLSQETKSKYKLLSKDSINCFDTNKSMIQQQQKLEKQQPTVRSPIHQDSLSIRNQPEAAFQNKNKLCSSKQINIKNSLNKNYFNNKTKIQKQNNDNIQYTSHNKKNCNNQNKISQRDTHINQHYQKYQTKEPIKDIKIDQTNIRNSIKSIKTVNQVIIKHNKQFKKQESSIFKKQNNSAQLMKGSTLLLSCPIKHQKTQKNKKPLIKKTSIANLLSSNSLIKQENLNKNNNKHFDDIRQQKRQEQFKNDQKLILTGSNEVKQINELKKINEIQKIEDLDVNDENNENNENNENSEIQRSAYLNESTKTVCLYNKVPKMMNEIQNNEYTQNLSILKDKKSQQINMKDCGQVEYKKKFKIKQSQKQINQSAQKQQNLSLKQKDKLLKIKQKQIYSQQKTHQLFSSQNERNKFQNISQTDLIRQEKQIKQNQKISNTNCQQQENQQIKSFKISQIQQINKVVDPVQTKNMKELITKINDIPIINESYQVQQYDNANKSQQEQLLVVKQPQTSNLKLQSSILTINRGLREQNIQKKGIQLQNDILTQKGQIMNSKQQFVDLDLNEKRLIDNNQKQKQMQKQLTFGYKIQVEAIEVHQQQTNNLCQSNKIKINQISAVNQSNQTDQIIKVTQTNMQTIQLQLSNQSNKNLFQQDKKEDNLQQQHKILNSKSQSQSQCVRQLHIHKESDKKTQLQSQTFIIDNKQDQNIQINKIQNNQSNFHSNDQFHAFNFNTKSVNAESKDINQNINLHQNNTNSINCVTNNNQAQNLSQNLFSHLKNQQKLTRWLQNERIEMQSLDNLQQSLQPQQQVQQNQKVKYNQQYSSHKKQVQQITEQGANKMSEQNNQFISIQKEDKCDLEIKENQKQFQIGIILQRQNNLLQKNNQYKQIETIQKPKGQQKYYQNIQQQKYHKIKQLQLKGQHNDSNQGQHNYNNLDNIIENEKLNQNAQQRSLIIIQRSQKRTNQNKIKQFQEIQNKQPQQQKIKQSQQQERQQHQQQENEQSQSVFKARNLQQGNNQNIIKDQIQKQTQVNKNIHQKSKTKSIQHFQNDSESVVMDQNKNKRDIFIKQQQSQINKNNNKQIFDQNQTKQKLNKGQNIFNNQTQKNSIKESNQQNQNHPYQIQSQNKNAVEIKEKQQKQCSNSIQIQTQYILDQYYQQPLVQNNQQRQLVQNNEQSQLDQNIQQRQLVQNIQQRQVVLNQLKQNNFTKHKSNLTKKKMKISPINLGKPEIFQFHQRVQQGINQKQSTLTTFFNSTQNTSNNFRQNKLLQCPAYDVFICSQKIPNLNIIQEPSNKSKDENKQTQKIQQQQTKKSFNPFQNLFGKNQQTNKSQTENIASLLQQKNNNKFNQLSKLMQNLNKMTENKDHPSILNQVIRNKDIKLQVLKQHPKSNESIMKIVKEAIKIINKYFGPDFLESKLIHKQNKEICLFIDQEWKILAYDVNQKHLLENYVSRYANINTFDAIKAIQMLTGCSIKKIQTRNFKKNENLLKLTKKLKSYLQAAQNKKQKYGQQKIIILLSQKVVGIGTKIEAYENKSIQKQQNKCEQIHNLMTYEAFKLSKKLQTHHIELQKIVNQIYQVNFSPKIKYQTIQVNPKAINTFQLWLGDTLIQVQGNFRFILYRQFQKDKYEFAKQAKGLLKYLSPKQKCFYLLIVEPCQKQQKITQSQQIQKLCLRYYFREDWQQTWVDKLIQCVYSGKAKSSNGGYQNQKNIYLPVNKKTQDEN